MPNPFPLLHPAEVLGGVNQPSQNGSDLPPTTQYIAHRPGQPLLLTRSTAWIGREKGRKVTFVAGTHAAQEPRKTLLCQLIQENEHTLLYHQQQCHRCPRLRWYGLVAQKCGSKLEKMTNRCSFSKPLATSTAAAELISPS